MWPSSWECLSPDTCVRCANVTDDTCLYNKFTCSCNYKDGDNTTCVHQEIIDIHKSKINASQSNINISLPGTSGISALNLKSKRRTKRKKKEKYKKEHIEPDYSDAAISETTNLLSPGNFLSPEGGDVNERERFLPSSKEKCHSDYLSKRITDESSSDSSNTSSCSSSSDSSSSSSSSSDSSSSNSSSCDESTKVTETTYKGYQIMKVNEDCDNSDYEDDSESNSSSSESADSTSASSDNSWWQEYKQLKEIQFFKKPNPDAMKDSGYVSTTSPNDSNIVDE